MEKNNLRVGFITALDPNDKRSWSGTYYRMSTALNEEFSTVINLGPIKLSSLNYYKIYYQLKTCEIFHRYIFKKKFNNAHNHIISKSHSRFFDKLIRQKKIDILFAPSASNEIAHLKTNIPICYYTDATVSRLFDYYDSFSDISTKSKKISNEIEQKAISKSTTQVFSSQWAYDSAMEDYRVQSPFIVKMGANIDLTPEDKVITKHYDSTINILFVGVDWKRKGGDIILETLKKLDKSGYDVKLTVVGCVPPQTHPKMEVIPFLDKNKEKEMLVFQDLFKSSHLFFLPTRAECFGIVFCEANAYGLPVITTDTGGVSSVIENGINGYMLPPSAGSEDYFMMISDLISDREKLKRMAVTSREKYLKELNWGQWGKKMKEILLKTFSMSNHKQNANQLDIKQQKSA